MISSCRLDNGLTLVHTEDNTTQMVSTNVLYRVGSANEDPLHTGLAHLLEHLMFGGSENAPLFDPPLENACGDNNAFTTDDYTDYYITLPAANIETALFLESDRMTRLVLTPHTLEVQRKVVMEEFKLHYINQPYGDVHHLLSKLVFEEGPYSWPTIGLKLSHIEDVDLSTVQDFYHRFYNPANAILTIAGNISWDRAKSLADKWFAPLASPPTPLKEDSPLSSSYPGSPHTQWNSADRHSSFFIPHSSFLKVFRPVPNNLLVVAWRIPSVLDDHFRAFDLTTDLLANGKSSRLYRSLIAKTHLALSVDAYVAPHLGDSMLIVEIIPADGVSTDQVEQALHEEMNRLLAQPVPKRELEKVKNKYETNLALQRANCHGVALQLAWYTLLGETDRFNTELNLYRALTPDNLHQTIAPLLQWEHAYRLHYLKNEE